MKNKFNFFEKRFLNRDGHHSIASVLGEVIQYGGDSSFTPFIGEFIISDCSRNINLSIDFQNKEAFENSIFKMKQLEEVSRNMRKALEKIEPEVQKWIEEKKNKNS